MRLFVASLAVVSLCACSSSHAPAARPDAAHSEAEVSPAGSIVADGTSAATVHVKILDSAGAPLAGAFVVLGASSAENAFTQPAAPPARTASPASA